MPADVTVIIPQFNRCHLTRRCVESLLAHHSHPLELVIADDGSDPADLAPDLSWLSARAQLLRLPHRGVTAAWNAAAAAARSDWLVFLNNDTGTLGPWLERLIEPLRTGAAAMTGVATRSERDLPAAAQGLTDNRRLLAGWCFAIGRQRLHALGGFDPALRLYYSDTDLQVRLLLDAGRTNPLLCVAGLPLIHSGHATAHRLPDHHRQWRRDRLRFLDKWSGGEHA